MGILKDLVQRYREKKIKEREYGEDIKIQRNVTEKMKNANERELERYMEESRQERIENQLRRLRKQKTHKLMTSNIFAQKGNMFKGKCYLGRYY